MRKILVFQHVPFEPLGSLDRAFRSAGFRIRFLNFDRRPAESVSLDRYHGLVVLGGPMAADQTDRYPHLAYECDAIAAAAGRHLPVLGICLGAQLIARAIGGRTLRGHAREHGWVPVSPTAQGLSDPLASLIEPGEPIFQWHSDTFTLPPDAVHLAESRTCRYQSFRYGSSVYGLQFHLEANRPLIDRWVGAAQRTPGAPGRDLDVAHLMAETDRYLPRAEALGDALFGEFIRRFYDFRRRRAHASR